MTFREFLKPHRTWEDGVGLMLGLTIGLSPWLYDQPPVPAVVLNSALIGLAILMLAQLELVRLRRWHEVAQFACGLWLLASPLVIDYSHQDHLRLWHSLLGSLVCALAAFELWQNRTIARNGQ